MKKENQICPPVEGIGGMSDVEAFACFNVEIDENGSDLWEFRVIPKERKGARELRQDMIPTKADLMQNKVGRAGDESRIVALTEFYQKQLEKNSEQSAFFQLTD